MKVYEVSEINQYIKTVLDEDLTLASVCIRGEISNYKPHPSGHMYFSIKDQESNLRCVMFKGSTASLRFRPENGMKIVAMGRISVFPRDGAYQLYCNQMIPEGVGDLQVAFEQMKKKLEAMGYFRPEIKKAIPKHPETVALITARSGAALQDMLRIIRKRYPLVTVKVLSVRVQGKDACLEIAGAIRYANKFQLADVIITGRGGGSLEDLWAFNEEVVAKAIFESEIPVISAVGHEPDILISDYAADLRASTPSNAAELVVPDQMKIRQELNEKKQYLTTLMQRQIVSNRRHLSLLKGSRMLQNPKFYIDDRRMQLSNLEERLYHASSRQLSLKKQRYCTLVGKLDALSPLKVLSRGYSMTTDRAGNVIRSVKQIDIAQPVHIRFEDGRAVAQIKEVSPNE